MKTTFIKDGHRLACIEAIKELIAFPSVIQENAVETPFGQSIQDVLEHTLKLAADLGFSTYSQLKQEQDKSASRKVSQFGNTLLRCFLM